jgi:integrase
MKLTKTEIENFQMPPGKTEHWARVDGIPNLYLRARNNGSKLVVHTYKFGGKTRKTSFGSADKINLSKTCEAARDLNAAIRLGQDPVGERAAAKVRATETFGAIVPRFLTAQRAHRRNPHSYSDQERHLLTHSKLLHPLALEKITRRHIATVIAAVAENSGLRTGNQVRASLNAFFKFSMNQGFIDHNPVIGTAKNPEQSRDRVLAPAELRVIWNSLSGDDDQFSAILKVLMLSGQRAGEIGGLRWSELDLDKNVILLPASRTKNGHSHVVPLSGPMRNILAAQPRRITPDGKVRDLIFGFGEGPFSGWSSAKASLDARIETVTGRPLPPWRVHDLRRSFATHAAELGVRSDVIELCLNHRTGRSGIIGVYNKSELMPERRTAFDRFAEWLTSVIEGTESKITALRQA